MAATTTASDAASATTTPMTAAAAGSTEEDHRAVLQARWRALVGERAGSGWWEEVGREYGGPGRQ